MFPALKTEVEARFDAINLFFGATRNLTENHAAIAKGLMFVQMYAVYEFTVNSVVSAAIDSIKSYNHKMKDMSPSLMALFLDPELNSLRDGQRRNEWNNRLKLFERVFSRETLNLSSGTRPPNDGSHYRYTHLVLIFQVFGIRRLPVRRRNHIQRITEVVDHRNSIAHGNERAEDIGRRYTKSEIQTAIRQMKSVCMLLLTVFDEYCADPSRHCR
jgi:hypothetical protein